jgi:hypothetical protein
VTKVTVKLNISHHRGSYLSMPLSLKIPALSEKPLLIAETRAAKLFEFVEKLPLNNPLQAAATLLDEMEILNRQRIAPDARIRALEIYRPVLLRISEMLATYYAAATLPLPAQAKEYAAVAESLWLELGYGYKLALIDQQGKLFTLGGSKTNALILQRAIESLGKLAMVYYQTYVTPPGSLWQDLHQLYAHAAQESLLDVEIVSISLISKHCSCRWPTPSICPPATSNSLPITLSVAQDTPN